MTVDDEYTQTIRCSYEGREYLVRDNGAICRVPRSNTRPAKYDGVWTFGVKDSSNGYMFLASTVRVHRVVCTAFHGPAPQQDMVVDHRDTNRCNNRPENLRWVTRLENALENPVTRKKIIALCGSLEAFLDDPSIIRTKACPPDVAWMKTVTRAEADYCRKRVDEWARIDSEFVPSADEPKRRFQHFPNERRTQHVTNIAPNREIAVFCEDQCLNRRWECRVLSHGEASLFPNAPLASVPREEVLEEYLKSLRPDSNYLLSYYYKLVVNRAEFIDERRIRVLAERAGAMQTGWYVFEVTATDDALFHQKIGSFGKNRYSEAFAAFRDEERTGWPDYSGGKAYRCELDRGRIRIVCKIY